MSEWEVRGGDDGILKFTDGTERGVQLGTEYLLQQANRTVPIEESTLQRSGRATVQGNTGVVSYDTPYAKRQHEELDYRHDPGRRAKWLELAMAEEHRTIGEIIAAELRGEL